MEYPAEGFGQTRTTNAKFALVVTENTINGVVIASIVERAGFHARQVAPHDAVSEILDEKPDVLVLDAISKALTERLASHNKNLPYIIAIGGDLDIADDCIRRPASIESLHPALSRFKKSRGVDQH